MKNSDRLTEIAETVGDLQPEYQELIEIYRDFEQALESGESKVASRLRERAERWMKDNNRFTELAYFPPEGTSINLTAWQQFVKFNFGTPKKVKQ